MGGAIGSAPVRLNEILSNIIGKYWKIWRQVDEQKFGIVTLKVFFYELLMKTV